MRMSLAQFEVRVIDMPTSRTVSFGLSAYTIWCFGYHLAPAPLWWWTVSEYVDFGENLLNVYIDIVRRLTIPKSR